MLHRTVIVLLMCSSICFPTLYGLKRDCDKPTDCPQHFLETPHTAPILPFIPVYHEPCWEVDCSVCHCVYPFETGKNNEWGWICDCCSKPQRTLLSTWTRCPNKAIYSGYFERDFATFYSLFSKYIDYVKNARKCACYWPESCSQAAAISDTAYDLFDDLFTSTDLKIICKDRKCQEVLLPDCGEGIFLSQKEVVITCICHCFFFSDYDSVLNAIDDYSYSKFPIRSFEAIQEATDSIRQQLAQLFFPLYRECLSKHPNEKIKNEYQLVGDLVSGDMGKNL